MNREVALKKLRQARSLILVFSVIVFLLIALMGRIHFDTGYDLSFLAAFHSGINALTFFILIYALIQIRKGNVKGHQNAIYVALTCSVLFLLSYIIYHLTVPEKRYCGTGTLRYIYFAILSSHILLSAVMMPFILFTFARAYFGLYELHKKMARWVFPFWLYIAATGPIIYLMLRKC